MEFIDSLSATSVIVGIIVGVGSVLAGVFKMLAYVTQNVVAPMQVSINQLSDVTQELRVLLEQLRKDACEQDRRITVCEQSCKAAHHRLDTLEDRVDSIA
ncbi:hypothetical protein [Mitsuokella sp.]|uniref:hypothetical protein n=1 Tax=Mitsuokella sp. TaxID=2049034 RepID=UPI003D7C4387